MASTLKQRVKRRAGILVDRNEVIEKDGSTDSAYNRVFLENEIVYDIIEVVLNGTTQTQGATDDYTWNKYSPYITFNSNLSQGDVVKARIQVHVNDDVIDHEIQSTKREIRGWLIPYYTKSEIDGSPTFEDLVEEISIGELLQRMVQGQALESSKYRRARRMIQEAKQLKNEVRQGGAGLLDSSGSKIDKRVGSLVGGPQNLSEDDEQTRADKLDHLSDYDDQTLDFTNAVRDTRE